MSWIHPSPPPSPGLPWSSLLCLFWTATHPSGWCPISCHPHSHISWSHVCTVVILLSQTVLGHLIVQIQIPPCHSPALPWFGPAWSYTLIFYHFVLHRPSSSLPGIPTFLAIIQVIINLGPLPYWFSVPGRHHRPSSLCTADSFLSCKPWHGMLSEYTMVSNPIHVPPCQLNWLPSTQLELFLFLTYFSLDWLPCW